MAPKTTLLLHLSGLNMFADLRFDECDSIEKEEQLMLDNGRYDLIVGDLPLNIKKVESELFPKGKVNKNWDLLYKAVQKLNPKGLAIFIVEPAILFSSRGRKVLKILEEDGFIYYAAFNTPENILDPITTFRPILLAFSTTAGHSIFVGEIGDENNLLLKNFVSKTDTERLETGKLIPKGEFNSFSGYATSSQIGNLKKQYKNYQLYKLEEVTVKTNRTKSKFDDLVNSFYIRRVGNSKVVSSLRPSDESKYFFQIQLDERVVLADYLVLFYQSNLGRLILDSLNSGSFISHISKSDLLESTVAIPGMEEQRLLIKTSSKLRNLQEIITKLQLEIGLNPKNVSSILEQYDSIQEPLKSLSLEDEVLAIIRKGEGKFIEFKQTFSRNIVTLNKDVAIEKSSLKTVVGFLNAHGGTLLIGVNDKGIVTGIEEDLFNSQDSYLLHFRNAVNSKIGPEFYPHIDYDIISILGKMILKVVCQPSKKPCFYDKKEFFVRTNPATDKLVGQQLVEYINHHF